MEGSVEVVNADGRYVVVATQFMKDFDFGDEVRELYGETVDVVIPTEARVITIGRRSGKVGKDGKRHPPKQVIVYRPMFSGYVFVGASEGYEGFDWRTLFATRSIAGVLMNEGRAVWLSGRVVNKFRDGIRERLKDGVKADPAERPREHSSVAIVETENARSRGRNKNRKNLRVRERDSGDDGMSEPCQVEIISGVFAGAIGLFDGKCTLMTNAYGKEYKITVRKSMLAKI